MSNSMKGRFQNKHDTEANWIKATNFVPLQGELIIYDVDATHDYVRFKIGDGVTDVNNLPFLIDNVLAQAQESGEYEGEDGYTPIRGTDYWTEVDKAIIKTYVDAAIASSLENMDAIDAMSITSTEEIIEEKDAGQVTDTTDGVEIDAGQITE